MSAHQMHDLYVQVQETRRYTVIAGDGERVVDWESGEAWESDGTEVFCSTCGIFVGHVDVNEVDTDIVIFDDDEESYDPHGGAKHRYYEEN